MPNDPYILFPVAAALILAIVEAIKRMGLRDKYSPIPAAVLGMVAGWLWLVPDDWRKGVLLGLVCGLTSIGAYSGPKNVVEALRGEPDKPVA